jgi:hypothetical protein
MKTVLRNILAHFISLPRLAWVPSPDLATRWRSVPEYFQLSRLQRRVMRPGGLYAEMNRVLQKVRRPQRTIESEEVKALLQPQQQARWIHPTAQCLAKSLRIMEILRAAGVCGENVRFRVGLRRAAVGFRGHAWVECDGVALLEEPFEPEEYERIWEEEELLRTMTDRPVQMGRYRVKPGVLVHAFDADEVAALDLADGVCFGLTGCSYVIWREIVTRGTVEESVQRIAAETRADVGVVESDVREFVDQLMVVGLLQAA